MVGVFEGEKGGDLVTNYECVTNSTNVTNGKEI